MYIGLIKLTDATASVFIFGGDKRQREICLLSQAKSDWVGIKMAMGGGGGGRGVGWRDGVIRDMRY